MRYLITGGAGFIGSHLAEELLRRLFDEQRELLDRLPAPALQRLVAQTLLDHNPNPPRILGQIGDERV